MWDRHLVKCVNGFPHPDNFFWHGFWHIIYYIKCGKYIIIYLDILSGIYSDILSDTHSCSLSGVYADIVSGVLSLWHKFLDSNRCVLGSVCVQSALELAGVPAALCLGWAGIFSSINSDVLFGILSAASIWHSIWHLFRHTFGHSFHLESIPTLNLGIYSYILFGILSGIHSGMLWCLLRSRARIWDPRPLEKKRKWKDNEKEETIAIKNLETFIFKWEKDRKR